VKPISIDRLGHVEPDVVLDVARTLPCLLDL